MALKEYQRKRDFSRTPEPRPREGQSETGWSYLIQKHAATRLHYDFRLELDGVLLSWAVTKGPSLDPKDKRLAVRTEDHPLDYGAFEGTIPKGEYGGGTVMLWDRGTWEPKGDPRAGLESGHLSFVLHGERLRGEWDLVRMQWDNGKRENWLLIKHKDSEARAGAAADLTATETVSVASGRSMAEIAGGVQPAVAKPKAARSAAKSRPKSAAKEASGALVVGGVTITHPDRVISEIGQITKGELAEYYARVAPVLLPGIVRRPVSLLRCPEGIDGDCFYQRNPGQGLGPDVHAFRFEHQGKSFQYLYIEDEKGLFELVQMGAIELHPWGASIDAIDTPDRMIFDLDPGTKVEFAAVKVAATELRKRLAEKGLESGLKCTGGKGLHVTVALAAKDAWTDVKAFAREVADEMTADSPQLYTATMSKAKRVGKVFIDYLRNDYTATAIADYAVRARPGAPVAVPLDWEELAGLASSNQFTISKVLERVAGRRAGRKPKGQRIPG